jgi:hypothetical protein
MTSPADSCLLPDETPAHPVSAEAQPRRRAQGARGAPRGLGRVRTPELRRAGALLLLYIGRSSFLTRRFVAAWGIRATAPDNLRTGLTAAMAARFVLADSDLCAAFIATSGVGLTELQQLSRSAESGR